MPYKNGAVVTSVLPAKTDAKFRLFMEYLGTLPWDDRDKPPLNYYKLIPFSINYLIEQHKVGFTRFLKERIQKATPQK